MTKVHQVHAAAAAAGAAAVPQLESDAALEHEADRMAERIGAAPAPAGPDAAITAGGALGPGLQREMQGHFGHDFSQVRVHADAGAARAAGDLDAAAFTVGNDVVFNSGRLAPGTRQGRQLLAHELSHVVQQSQMASPVVQRQPLLGGGSAGDDDQAAMTWESYRQAITVEGFDSDMADLKPEHVAQLDDYKLRLQMLLGRYPDSFFSVIGHTDATDSEAHNKQLGQRRADAVKDHLASGDNPVPAKLLSAGSLGETALAVPSKGREARNRRVEIIPTLRRTSIKFAPPGPTTVLPGTGGGLGTGGLGGAADKGPGTWIDPDPLGLRKPKLPDLLNPRHNWLEDALDRDPLVRSLPKWMGDKVKDALKDGDEMLAEKVIDALPLDDKVKAAVQAVVKGVLQLAKGKTFKTPEAPTRKPDFGPKQEFPKFPGEVIIPGPKFEW